MSGVQLPVHDDITVRVHEIYASVQGESTYVGMPCTFVRLSRCNLRCRWCDTPDAFEGGEVLALSDVVARTLAFETPMVLVTGGEPLLQKSALPLLNAFCDAGKLVLLETSGERDISGVDPRVRRIVDLKAPGSGECDKNRMENLTHLRPHDEVKFVLADRVDYEWARELVRREELHTRVNAVLFSCVFGELEPKTLSGWILEDHVPARLQLQSHKYIFGADAKGV